jgi:hypothetical protein
MSLSSDSPNRLFFVTGNGEGHQNREVPASGRTPLDALDETIVNLRIYAETGKLSLQDYFEPYEYIVCFLGVYRVTGRVAVADWAIALFSQWMLGIGTWGVAA